MLWGGPSDPVAQDKTLPDSIYQQVVDDVRAQLREAKATAKKSSTRTALPRQPNRLEQIYKQGRVDLRDLK